MVEQELTNRPVSLLAGELLGDKESRVAKPSSHCHLVQRIHPTWIARAHTSPVSHPAASRTSASEKGHI